MSYYGQAGLAQDRDFKDRIAACVASQGIAQALRWVEDNCWQISAAPGFAEAYSYALATKVERPGQLESVISDSQILAAVHELTPR